MPPTMDEDAQQLPCSEELSASSQSQQSAMSAPSPPHDPPQCHDDAPSTALVAVPEEPRVKPTCTKLIGTVVDEQTPLVMLACTQPPGSTLYLEAGAGAGKTTVAERLIQARKTDAHGERLQLLATTMTKAGVNEMKSRGGIPNSIVKSLHSLGYEAICTSYKKRLVCSLKHHGILAHAPEIKDIRMPRPHNTKYHIMVQHILPPSPFDKEPYMCAP